MKLTKITSTIQSILSRMIETFSNNDGIIELCWSDYSRNCDGRPPISCSQTMFSSILLKIFIYITLRFQGWKKGDMIENTFATDIRLITLYFVDACESKETLQMTLNFPASKNILY